MDGRFYWLSQSSAFATHLIPQVFPVLITFQRGRSEHSNRKYTMKIKHLLTAFICVVAPVTHASDDVNLDEIVVTATRIEQPLKQTLSSTSIITREDIQASQAVDVPSALKNLAGIEVYQSGGVGKQSSLFMRGTNSSHVLVLLDGVRISSATSGATAIDQIMLDQVERIEVVRGNASSLYGSDAIGGVVQIFTRSGKGKMAFNGSAGFGTNNTQRVSAGLGGQSGNTDFHMQVSKFRTDGVSAINPVIASNVNPDTDGYDNTSLSANVRHSLSAGHFLSASLFDSNANNQTDNPYGLSTDVNTSKAHIRKSAIASDNRISEGWQSKLQLSQGVDDIRNFLNGSPDVALGAQFKTTNDLLSWQNTLRVGNDDALIIGLEKLNQQVSSGTLYSRTSRSDDSLFTGYTGHFGAQQAQLNLRRDNYSDFGIANTWLLGYGFDVNTAWRVTANTSTAFKAPTLNDLFYPFTDYGFGYSYVGNPNLKPERSLDNELGVHYANNGQSMDVVYFDNTIRDLIVGDNLPAGSMINLNEARIDGVEVSVNSKFDDITLKFAMTQQNPRDAQTGQVLLRRAKLFTNLAVSRQIGAWRIGGEWQYSGERQDIDINTFNRTTLGSYNQVNLITQYKLDKHLDLSLRADNLFKQDYMLAHGYNTLGRTLFVGLNYQQ